MKLRWRITFIARDSRYLAGGGGGTGLGDEGTEDTGARGAEAMWDSTMLKGARGIALA